MDPHPPLLSSITAFVAVCPRGQPTFASFLIKMPEDYFSVQVLGLLSLLNLSHLTPGQQGFISRKAVRKENQLGGAWKDVTYFGGGHHFHKRL